MESFRKKHDEGLQSLRDNDPSLIAKVIGFFNGKLRKVPPKKGFLRVQPEDALLPLYETMQKEVTDMGAKSLAVSQVHACL